MMSPLPEDRQGIAAPEATEALLTTLKIDAVNGELPRTESYAAGARSGQSVVPLRLP